MNNPLLNALNAIAQRLKERHSAAQGTREYIAGSVARLATMSEAMHKAYLTRNPTETEATHTKRTAQQAERLGKDVTASINRVSDVFRGGLAQLESRRNAKLKLIPDAYAAEIRAVYRSMSPQDRTALLRQLVEENRGPELAALTRAHRSLTGISEQHIEQYEAAFVSHNAPEEAAEEAALKEAFDDAMVAMNTAGRIANAYSNPKKLAEILSAEAAAQSAARAFESAAGTGA